MHGTSCIGLIRRDTIKTSIIDLYKPNKETDAELGASTIIFLVNDDGPEGLGLETIARKHV